MNINLPKHSVAVSIVCALLIILGLVCASIGCTPQIVKQAVGGMRDTIDKTAKESTEPVVQKRAERMQPVAAQTEAYIGSPATRMDVESDVEAQEVAGAVEQAAKIKGFLNDKVEGALFALPFGIGGILYALREAFRRKAAEGGQAKMEKGILGAVKGGNKLFSKLDALFDKDPETKLSISEIKDLAVETWKDTQAGIAGSRDVIDEYRIVLAEKEKK